MKGFTWYGMQEQGLPRDNPVTMTVDASLAYLTTTRCNDTVRSPNIENDRHQVGFVTDRALTLRMDTDDTHENAVDSLHRTYSLENTRHHPRWGE